MGRKQDKKTKKRVTLSLAEFNENAGVGGAHPEVAALPSAPKAPEQWEAVGGRPEYNSRGYKERSTGQRDRRARTDADDDDWTRREPLDNDSGFGAMDSERDWSTTRREQPMSEQPPERDWTGIRRGPVEAEHTSRSFDRDRPSRSGSIDPDLRTLPSEVDWRSVRQGTGPVEAEFSESRNLSHRNPVDAEMKPPTSTNADWSNRKGPVEAEFSEQTNLRDWSSRKGPVEANPGDSSQDWSDVRKRASVDEQVAPQKEVDWSGVRQGPVEAAVPNSNVVSRPEVDWSAKRSPVKSKAEIAAARLKDGKEKQPNFEAVRGNKLRDMQDANSSTDRVSWRRDNSFAGFTQTKARGSYADHRTRPPSTGSDAMNQERDWSAARRSLPEALNPTNSSNDMRRDGVNQEQSYEGTSHTKQMLAETSDGLSPDADDETEVTEEVKDIGDAAADVGKPEDDDEWTTVKASTKKVAQQARRQVNASRTSWRGRGGRDFGGRGGFRGTDRGGPPRTVRPGFEIVDEPHVAQLAATSAHTEL